MTSESAVDAEVIVDEGVIAENVVVVAVFGIVAVNRDNGGGSEGYSRMRTSSMFVEDVVDSGAEETMVASMRSPAEVASAMSRSSCGR